MKKKGDFVTDLLKNTRYYVIALEYFDLIISTNSPNSPNSSEFNNACVVKARKLWGRGDAKGALKVFSKIDRQKFNKRNAIEYDIELAVLKSKNKFPRLSPSKTIKWRDDFDQLMQKGEILVSNGKAFILTHNGWLAAFKVASHAFLWAKRVAPKRVPPSITYPAHHLHMRDGVLFVKLLKDGYYAAFKHDTGEVLWTFTAWTPLLQVEVRCDAFNAVDQLGGKWKCSLKNGNAISCFPQEKKRKSIDLPASSNSICRGRENKTNPDVFKRGGDNSYPEFCKAIRILCESSIDGLENNSISNIKKSLMNNRNKPERILVPLVIKLQRAYIKALLTRVSNKGGSWDMNAGIIRSNILKALFSGKTFSVVAPLIDLLPEDCELSGWRLFVSDNNFKAEPPAHFKSLPMAVIDGQLVEVLEHLTGVSFGLNKSQWKIWLCQTQKSR